VPGPRTPEQWAAVHFVRALKQQVLRGYSYVPLPGGGRAYLDPETASEATAWFGQMAARQINWDQVASPGLVALVPIPDASCSLSSQAPSRTTALASALVAGLPAGKAILRDVLRWATPMPSAHDQGGTREPQELYSAFRLTMRRLPEDGLRYVLVDDVLASGAHIRAAAAFLTDCGADVGCAICAAQAVYDASCEPFAIRTESLPFFDADPDWLLPFA
jgi:hypothetical protein